ncbi:acyl-CoA dehydrogenase family protein, partial [Leucobacter massiliensis]|uniref:acyl-CoA dehydrogenase family protein n=1 Tax=Leucobacter massiliensis TaxID=1686285 RepID=UPI0015E44202
MSAPQKPPREPEFAPDAVFGIDPFDFARTHLSPAAIAALRQLQDVLDRRIRPLVDEAWETATMPGAVLDALAPLRLMEPDGVSSAEAGSTMFSGFRNFVLARTDASVVTLYNAQSGLFRSTVLMGGSPEQAAALDPRIRSFAYRGAFALTEPDHGSDIAGGMATTASREGEEWVITGAKRWIGGAIGADVLAVFARDTSDGEVKCFLVPREAEGVRQEVLRGKIALRPMQNSHIVLDRVRVPESARLQRIESWRDVSAIMRPLRVGV